MRDRDVLLNYYQKELDYILGAGAQFQAKYAGVSSHLQVDRVRDDDPHVARLLEGFAFLTARIRAKLEDEFPEITDAFLEVLHPHLLRPFPSASVVEFARRPFVEAPPGGETIEAGTPLRARHHDYRSCRFRTVYPVTLWPLEITSAEFLTDRIAPGDRQRGDLALLRMAIRGDGPGGIARLGLDRLRFYLAGEDRVAFALHDLIGSAVARVELRTLPNVPSGSGRAVLGPRSIQPVGFAPGEGMIPYPRRVPRGYRFIQEYACFAHKFLFFDLAVPEVTAFSPTATAFEILIFFNRPPLSDLVVEPRHVRLGCTPIINLFKAASAPIRLTRTRSVYPVVPNEPGKTEIYQIDRVAGARAELEQPVDYRSFYEYRSTDGDRTPPFWHAHRREAGDANGWRTGIDLAFGNENFDPFVPTSDEIVSVALTCTNGDAPFGMPTDQRGGDFEPEGTVACGAVRCVLPPSKSVRPPTGRGAQWRLISNLALNYLSLAPITRPGASPGTTLDDDDRPNSARDALVDLLSIYTPTGDRTVSDRLAGISAVTSRQIFGPAPGGRGAVAGVEVSVQFDESRFLGHSSVLLESVLDRFFGLYVSINSFSQLVVIDDHGQILRRWPARSGEKSLL